MRHKVYAQLFPKYINAQCYKHLLRLTNMLKLNPMEKTQHYWNAHNFTNHLLPYYGADVELLHGIPPRVSFCPDRCTLPQRGGEPAVANPILFWHLAVLPPSSTDTGPPEQGACINGPGAARGPNACTGLARCFCGRTTSSNSSEPVNMRRETPILHHICCEQLTKLWSGRPTVSYAQPTIVRNNKMVALYTSVSYYMCCRLFQLRGKFCVKKL